ncbi:MAG: polysaccharide biosynthesis C-terminal domain-containing protein [Candidatus Eisenbacteria bacterium]|nr:polysaccharide biosynthesis C-terminal domain-containing protein [Candidatus Eisenbacteria bacterium]
MKRLLRAGTWVVAGTLLGKLAGFLREVVLASRVGVGAEADLAVVLFTLPDMVLNLLVGGAFGAALVPEFAQLGATPARRLMFRSSLVVVVAAALMGAVLVVFASPLVRMLGPGLSRASIGRATTHARLLLATIPLSAVTAVMAAYLTAGRRFAVPAMGTLAYNLVVIAGVAMVAAPLDGITIGIIGGSLLRLTLHAWRTGGTRLEAVVASQHSHPRDVVVRYLEALAASSVLMAYPIVARTFASLGDPGSVAVVNYAGKLVELPNGIVLGVFAVVLFPTLSSAFAEGRSSDAERASRRAIRMVIWLAFPLAVGVALFARDFATVALMRGKLDVDAANRVGSATAWWALSLPAQAASSILVAMLNARKDTRTALLTSLLGLAALVAVCVATRGRFGVHGVVAGMVLAYWAVLIAQTWTLKRRGLDLFEAGLVRLAFGTSAMAVAGFAPFVLVARAVPSLNATHRLALAGLGGMLALAACSRILGDDRARLLDVVWKRRST